MQQPALVETSNYPEVVAMRMEACKGKGIGTKLLKTLCAGVAALALFVCASLNVQADDTLSCYKGDKDNRIFVGEISGADFQNAAAECNSFYGDCNGECFGCYLAEDSTSEICVDSQGKKFTR